jgi:hypothetical protein
MELPLAVTKAGGRRSQHYSLTNNVSSTGVLFTGDLKPGIGQPLEYVLTLAVSPSGRVTVRCAGRVVRCGEVPGPGERSSYEVAATLERYEFQRSD